MGNRKAVRQAGAAIHHKGDVRLGSKISLQEAVTFKAHLENTHVVMSG